MEMTHLSLNDILPSDWDGPMFGSFEPCASYSAPMDCIIYLREDVSFRAERIDQFLTILWHPQNDVVVGIKLKGCRFIFDALRSAVKTFAGKDIPEQVFMPLVGAIEFALKMRLGAEMVDEIEKKRASDFADLNKMYDVARGIVGEAVFDSRPLLIASS